MITWAAALPPLAVPGPIVRCSGMRIGWPSSFSPASCVVESGERLAREAFFGAPAPESGGPECPDQPGRIPLENGHGAAR